MRGRPNVSKMITIREFRNNFHRITEPVKVIKAQGEIKVLGTWLPEQNGTAKEPTQEA